MVDKRAPPSLPLDQSNLPGWAPNLIGAQKSCRTILPRKYKTLVQTPGQPKSFVEKRIKIKGKLGLCLLQEVVSTPFLNSNNFNTKRSLIGWSKEYISPLIGILNGSYVR